MQAKIIILLTATVILEALLRIIPTARNWSLLHGLIRIIDMSIPNRYKKSDSLNVEKGKFIVTKKISKK